MRLVPYVLPPHPTLVCEMEEEEGEEEAEDLLALVLVPEEDDDDLDPPPLLIDNHVDEGEDVCVGNRR